MSKQKLFFSAEFFQHIGLIGVAIVLLSLSVFALESFDVNSQGGVYNGGFEYGSGTASTGGFLVNSNYGIYLIQNVAGWNATFDNTVFYSGKQSIRIDTNQTARAYVSKTHKRRNLYW